MLFLLLTNKKRKRERNQVSLLLLSSKMLKSGNRNTCNKRIGCQSEISNLSGLSSMLKNGSNFTVVCVCGEGDCRGGGVSNPACSIQNVLPLFSIPKGKNGPRF